MPVDLNLTVQEERWFNRACCAVGTNTSSSYTEVTAELLDRNRKHVSWLRNLPDGGWSGQVDLDTSQAASSDGTTTGSIWSAELTTLDPDGDLQLGAHATFLDRLLRIIWSVRVPELVGSQRRPDGMVDVPIFCGPCSAPVVAGDKVTIEAQGMEVWARGQATSARMWRKGAQITAVIRDILVNHIGEPPAWLDFASVPDRLTSNFKVTAGQEWWAQVLYLAETIGCKAFYGRDSVCHVQPPGRAVYALRDGPNGAMIGIPQRSTSLGPDGANSADGIPNRFLVIGQAKPQKPPKHGKPPKPPLILGRWDVPDGNRFSATSIGHPGFPRVIIDSTTLEHVHTDAAAKRIAEMRGRRSLQIAQQVTDETVVVPHLNPFDRYFREADGASATWLMLASSIPLDWSPANPMTWNFVRQVSTMEERRHRP